MRLSVLCAAAFFVSALSLSAEDTAMVRAADGFQYPVGPNGTAEGYYIARGYRPNGHLGEDWNGVHGGDTDLGDPVYATANGFVTFARNYHVGWGNVVILRHAYYEGSALKYCDSLYGHLLDFAVQEGQQVRRGQQIGRIGNNFGMYEAHLHFEMRKNLQIGMFRSSFLRDFSNYYTPNQFVAEHHFCPNGNRMVSVPINTYPPVAPPIIAGPHVESPMFGVPSAGSPAQFARIAPLPPAGSSVLTPLPAPTVKIITKAATPTPVPSTPEPKIAKSKPVAATPPPPAPAPVVKTFRTGTSSSSVALASPSPSPSAKHGKTIAATSTPEPTVKITTAPATDVVAKIPVTPATPTPATKSSKITASAATPTPAGKSSKKSSSSTSVAAVSPTPSPTKSSRTTASVSTPVPARKTAQIPAPVAAPPTPTTTPSRVAANKTRKTPGANPTPQPATVTRADTDTIASDPLLPAPTAKGAPIERTGSTFKVDRFEDLRKAGY